MEEFLRVHERHVMGVLNGFDRLVLRGCIRRLSFVSGMMSYLSVCGVLLKEFGALAQTQTERLRAASLELAGRLDRPILYMPSPQVSKEDTARAIAERDGIREGLVGFMNARQQTWFPFAIQVCLNGREWLASSPPAPSPRQPHRPPAPPAARPRHPPKSSPHPSLCRHPARARILTTFLHAHDASINDLVRMAA